MPHFALESEFFIQINKKPDRTESPGNHSLYRNWFEYDQSRQAIPGLVSNWKFDQNAGTYIFTISEKANWSDGTPLTSDHLVKNLKRLIINKSSYGASIDALIDIKAIKILDEKHFQISMKNKKPSTAFFQRMGSSFLAVTHPLDWDQSGNVIKNTNTIGPYYVENLTSSGLTLKFNKYDFLSSENRFQELHIKFSKNIPNLESFLEGKSFEGIIQTFTLMPVDLYNKILISKLPFWTRAYDRVSFIAPIRPYLKNSENLRFFLKAIGKVFHEQADRLNVPKTVKIAHSLQPLGYPLNDRIKYELGNKQFSFPDEISILTLDGYQYKIQKPIVEKLAKQVAPNIKIKWVTRNTIGEVLSEANPESKYDLKLLSFGVADPEAATWLSLVMNKERPIVELSERDSKKFEDIMVSHSGQENEVLELRKLLTSIGERGGYLPLFHFSTMSIGKAGISFEKISELDETINYSKLISK